MYYYVKNESGNVSDVTKEIYEDRKDKDGYECWKEDPYKDLPEDVTEVIEQSTDYTVREALDKMEDMTDSEIQSFVSEDEDRVTITRKVE